MAEHFDILIIGGGVVGASTAYHLAALGDKKIGLIEREQIGSGGTGRSCAIVRTHYSVRSNTALTVKSLEMFSDFASYLDDPELTSGFVRSGYLILAGEGKTSDMLVDNMRMQESVGAETFPVTHDEALTHHPHLKFDDIGAVGYEPRSGYADPHLTTSGFAQAARRRGVMIKTGCRVSKILCEGQRAVGVETDQGPIHADCIISAIGPWTRELTDPLGIETHLDISRHTVLTLRGDIDYGPELPVIKDLSTENKMYFRPASGGVVLVGTGDHGDPITNADDVSETVEDDFILTQGGQIAQRMANFDSAEITDSWVGVYDITPDWNPALGAPEGWQGLILAYGFSGHGFKLGPAVGKMLAQSALGQEPDVDITPYRLSRFDTGDLLTGTYGIGSIA